MSRITDYLEALSLSEIESKLYLTLLESGPITVRELASVVDMKRTTAYLYIDHLIEKGLIMKIVKGPLKLIAVVDPEVSLKKLVQDKVDTAVSLKNDLPAIVKHISDSLPEGVEVGDAEIKFYKGKNGVKKIYEEALKSKELRSYVNMSDVVNYFPENASTFDEAFEKNKELELIEFIEDSPVSRDIIKVLAQNKRYKFKFLPKDIQVSASDILLYDGHVAIINLRESTTGVVFHNKDYFNISKELFDHMWRTHPDWETTIEA